MRRSRELGFSVMECVVAVAILSFGLLTLLTLRAQNAREASINQQHYEQNNATLNALSMLEDVNPMQEPSGSRTLDNFSMEWTSKLIAGPLRSVGKDTPDGHFDVTLYQVDVSVASGAKRLTHFSTEKTGWRLRSEAAQ